MSASSNAARGGGVTLAGQAVRLGIQFATVVVVTRLLEPSDIGLVAMVMAIVTVAEVLRDFGLSTSAVQAARLADGERTNLFWANLGIGCVLALAIGASGPALARIYGEPRAAGVTVVLASVFVLNGAAAQFIAELTRSLEFGRIAGIYVMSQLSSGLAAIAVAAATRSYWALVVQQLVLAIANLLLSVRASTFHPRLPDRSASIRHHFRFGSALAATQLLANLTQNIDKIALGRMFGAWDLGLYQRGYQLMLMPISAINAPLTRVAVPTLARIAHSKAQFGATLLKAQLFACYVTGTLFLLLAGLARPVVLILFGSGWEAAAHPFRFLCIAGLFRVLYQVAYWMVVADGKTGPQFRMYMVTQPAIWITTLLGLPWGVVGVAVGHAVGYGATWALTMIWSCRIVELNAAAFIRNALRSLMWVSMPVGVFAFVAAEIIVSPWLSVGMTAAISGIWLVAVSRLVAGVRTDMAVLRRISLDALRGDRRSR